LVREATERAKALWTTALADSDRLGQEAQARLQAAVATADQSIATAKAESAEIVRNAQREGRDLMASAAEEARALLTESLRNIEGQRATITQILEETATVRSTLSTVLDNVRDAVERSSTEASKADSISRAHLVSIDQIRTDFTRQLSKLSSVTNARK